MEGTKDEKKKISTKRGKEGEDVESNRDLRGCKVREFFKSGRKERSE